jgi:penicillin-binding protein 2
LEDRTEKTIDKHLRKRVWVFWLCIAILFGVLAIRLFTLQIVKGNEYATMSDQNQVRIVSQTARRGNIYDRNMLELANSKTVFAICVSSSGISKEDKETLSNNLAALLNDPEITAKIIQEKINSQARLYEPVVIKRVPYDDNISLITKLEENREILPGLMITEEPQRNYPLGNLAGHIIGQVGLLGEGDEELIEKYDYLMNDWIGKSGLEKAMERFTDENGIEMGLRGKRGIKKIEVNAKYRQVSVISEHPAVSGNSLVLTLDSKVQAAMEKSLQETIERIAKTRPKCQAGAAVLVNVKTGGVVAMASYPTMDPNDFSKGLSTERAAYYWDEDTKPLFNRAISGAYPPGSTFKPATALAAMAVGAITKDFKVTCSPAMWRAPRAKCPYSHGTVDLKEAMAKSCNAYFQEAGYRTGIDNLYKICLDLGLGQLSGIELTGEAKGTLANPEWKAENFTGWESEWRNYDTFYMSMGQGYNMYTPLQMANYVATIANDGVRMQSHIVDKILSPENEVLFSASAKEVASIDISQSGIAAVQASMRAVCEKGGTGYGLFGNYPVEVAAKTGTAQTGLAGDDKAKDYHGWFVAFAPYDDPQVAFAGVIEYGYHGSTSAGYVCKNVFNEYFGLNVAKEDIGIITGRGLIE